MEPYWNSVKQIIRESDIILEVIDARLVSLSRNDFLEKLIKEAGRPRIFVINKVDLTSKKELEYDVEKLLREGEVAFVSKKDRKSIKILLSKIKQVFSKHGKRPEYDSNKPLIKRPYREAKGDIIIGVVGYPNVGKSSIINSLCFKTKMKVSKTAGTTHGVHWIKATKNIKLIDTPGVIPLEKTDEVRLGLIAARNPEKIKDVDNVAGNIIQMFLKNDNDKSKLEKFYNIIIGDETNPYVILENIALKRNFLKKGGLPDEIRASTIIIRDWQEGRLRL